MRDELGSCLCAQLRARRDALVRATILRVNEVNGGGGDQDLVYLDGLRIAVTAAIDYGIAAFEGPPGSPPPIPLELLSQARLAARNRVGLDTVLRRYLAGYTLFGDFLVQAAEASGLPPGPRLTGVLRAHAAVLDRIVAAVTREYRREESRPLSNEGRRRQRVSALIAGRAIDPSEFRYRFEGWHIAAIGLGPTAHAALSGLASELDRDQLVIDAGEEVTWAWFGGREELAASEFADCWRREGLPAPALAVGEARAGLEGWRESHRQAQAAFRIARRRATGPVLYSEVALLACTLENEDLVSYLTATYLAPLAPLDASGRALRQTLSAYFLASRSVSSAAAALGVTRHTVTNRLRTIEETIGQPIDAHSAEIQLALRLAEYTPTTPR